MQYDEAASPQLREPGRAWLREGRPCWCSCAVAAVTGLLLKCSKQRERLISLSIPERSTVTISCSRYCWAARSCCSVLLHARSSSGRNVDLPRSRQLARCRRLTELEFTPGWTVGRYFVPFANLLMPFQAMRELQNAQPWRGQHVWQAQAPVGDVSSWWGAWHYRHHRQQCSAMRLLLDGRVLATIRAASTVGTCRSARQERPVPRSRWCCSPAGDSPDPRRRRGDLSAAAGCTSDGQVFA